MIDDDLPAVSRIGAAAGERFRSFDDPRVSRCADDPPYTVSELEPFAAAGRSYVALDERGGVCGFVLVEVVDGNAHVEEIAVDPFDQGTGVGTELLEAVVLRSGFEVVTLTTFRDVPWNRPFYERRGFVVVPSASCGPELTAKVASEAAHGLDPSIRVVMCRG
jgi:GNAT superfamily N-acetyltransferase